MSAKKNKNQLTPVDKIDTGKSIKPPLPVQAAIIDASIKNEHLIKLKEETLHWLFSIIGAIVVYFLVAKVITQVYHPDINALLALASKITFEGGVRPEPMEALLFRAGIVTILICITAFYILLAKAKFIKELAAKPFFYFFPHYVCSLLSHWYMLIFQHQTHLPRAAATSHKTAGTLLPKQISTFFSGVFFSVIIYCFIHLLLFL